ncbi:MAG: sodium:calcium antiporter [Myxococcota bacterium]|nr:sodium:calcium antiporter [Myxococcota bacterium]
MDTLIHLSMLVVGTALAWKGSGALETAGDRLARRYHLPAIVQGTLVVAVGSSFPEVTATIASALIHDEMELGVASVVGSAVFNILVIPGVSALSGEGLRYDLKLVYRDAQFYLTSVAVLLLAFSFALIYQPTGEHLTGTLDRWIVLVPLALYGLYLFLQHQETRGEGAERGEREAVDGPAWRDWWTLFLGLLLVVAGVEMLLRTALWLGDTLGTPSFIWGATVVAAATSLPDAVISVRGARRGDGDLSMGNVLGSNIFDLLVAIPAGVLVAGEAPVDFGVAAPLMGFLTLATIALFAFMRTRLRLTRTEGVLLLVLYAAFVGWLILETVGVTRWAR